MKNVICMLLLIAIAIIPLSGCADPGNSLHGTVPDTQPDTAATTQPDTTTDNVTIEQTEATEETIYDPYPIQDIEDDRITIEGSKKTYRDNGITFSFPADWIGLERRGEDTADYSFKDTKLDKSCLFGFSITSSYYVYERTTEAEYLELFSYSDWTDVKILSLTKETLSGYGCTKVVSSHSYEGTEYIRIDYDYVITGVRRYDFSVTYPASESATYEAVFESIINSLELTPV